MLRSLFDALDHHPAVYWFLAWSAMAVFTGWTIAPLWRSARPVVVSWPGAVAVAAVLLAWRWPFLLAATEFNPDESQLIAGAMALARDPVFWRSVDGTTSGPLNYYPLVPIAWLGLPLDFFTGRMAGLAMVFGGCWFFHRTLVLETDEVVARLGLVPVVVFFATTLDLDFLQYSSEHVSLILAPLALWLIARHRAGHGRWNLGAAAFALGALPWAKLQAAPISAALLLWIAALAWRSGATRAGQIRALAGATLCGAAFSILMVAMTSAGGVFDEMMVRYFSKNLLYVDELASAGWSLPGLLRRAAEQGQYIALSAVCSLAIAVGLIASVRQRFRPPPLFWIALGWGAVSLYAISAPKREFVHYLLFSVFPLGLAAALALAGLLRDATAQRRVAVAGSFLLLALVLPLIHRATQGAPFMIGVLRDHWRRPAFEDGAVLRSLRRPGDELAIWGWSPRTYIEARMPQATRDTHTFWTTQETAPNDPLRRAYLADLRARRPAFFLDATGDAAFFFYDRHRHGHEIFPELAEEIRRHYLPLLDFGYSRLYVREDRWVEARLTPADARRRAAGARTPESIARMDEVKPRENARLEDVANRYSLVLTTPARALVPIDSETRAVVFEARFHPRALAEGKSDGAELALDMVDNTGSHEFARVAVRFAPDERVRRRVILPATPRSEAIHLRALPGPTGNNAWDWIWVPVCYRERSDFFLPEQFPGFERLPVAANLPAAPLGQNADDTPAALPVLLPASFDLPLTRFDRSLQFEFSAGGERRVEVLVELVTAEGEIREITRQSATRLPHAGGVARFEAALPAARCGDRLRVSLTGRDGARVDLLGLRLR